MASRRFTVIIAAAAAGLIGAASAFGAETGVRPGEERVSELSQSEQPRGPEFEFPSLVGVRPGEFYESGPARISGIVQPQPISVTGGEYSINGANYTALAGTVYDGDTVTLRIRSADSYLTQATVMLTVGTSSAAFSVTTQEGPGVVDLAITGPATIVEGETAHFMAKARFSDGSTMTVWPVWTSSSPWIAEINPGGRLTAHPLSANNTVQISATMAFGPRSYTVHHTVRIVEPLRKE